MNNLKLCLLLVVLLSFGGVWGRRHRGRTRIEQDKVPQVKIFSEKGQNHTSYQEPKRERDGKWLSLFNIVQFPNDACSTTEVATLGSTSSNRNGTCLTSSECTDRGGAIRGSCAAGFGVCCLFIVNSDGGSVSQNCSYLQSPGFPSLLGNGVNTLSYTINKCRGDVCTFRLDFESFTIAGTGDTLETAGGTCLDSMTITVPTNQNIPTICGENTGQHIYVEVGNQPGDSATVNFNFATATNANRAYDIKVTQILCGAISNAPEGCLQYHTGLTGRFMTFNFEANENHLNDQRYSVCIRQELGFCCVQYSTCADATSAMSLDNVGSNNGAATDSLCSLDFLGIAASSTTCNLAQSNAAGVRSRYCGPFLSSQLEGMSDLPICDCTAPFAIDVFTNGVDDLDNAADPGTNTIQSRGVCLTWTQIPCNG